MNPRAAIAAGLGIFASVALLKCPVLCAAEVAPAPKRPNILLIISDDIGVDATSDMYPGLIDSLTKLYGPGGRNHPGYTQIKGHPASTPVLNGISRSGMRFTQTWVQPFCSPTRASILTGLYAAKTGMLDYTNYLSQNHHSFVRDLKDKGGYGTAVFGKWHMAGLNQYPGMRPKEAGFDLYRGNLNGAVSEYWNWEYHEQDDTSAAGEWRTGKAPVRSIPGVAPTTFAPVVNAADAIAWIREQESKTPGKPWFVWLAFNLAHITEKQQPNPMAVPNIDTLDAVSRREMESCGGNFGSANAGTCTDRQLMRAMTNSLDTITGKVLDVVDSLDRNTYVIYIGDNGTWMMGPPNRDFIDNMYITRTGRSKGTVYESGAHVPLVIRGPGIKARSSSDVPVNGVDLFATVLDLAGLAVPKTVSNRTGDGQVPLDSVSLTPVLFKGAKRLRDPDEGYLLTETINPIKRNLKQVGARNTRYKLVCDEKADAASCTFYDLREDPLEEYPLGKPASCLGYENRTWKPSAPEWNFCRLQEVIAKQSFLAAR